MPPPAPTDGFDSIDGAEAIAFSPDYRFAVKGSWYKGPILWEVADLRTGKVSTPIRAGRWLRLLPNGGNSNDISIAVAPASTTGGSLPVVAVLQNVEPLPNYYATPLPTPIPTPVLTLTPIPTDSPAQAQFKVRETHENAELQTLIESVEGVDGAAPQVTDEAEIARITLEVKRRNKALQLERKRLFSTGLTIAPTPLPTSSPWEFTERFQIEAFDLNTRKRLWVSALRANTFSPQMKFSPDGSGLVAWGTAVARKQYGRDSVESVGLEFRAALTGRTMSKSMLYEEDLGIPDESNVGVYADNSAIVNGTPRSVFVVKDVYTGTQSANSKIERYQRGTVFRFFNAANAHETGYLKVDEARLSSEQQDFHSLSISQGGKFWLCGDADVFISSRKELGQESSGPLPLPTPLPTSAPLKHADGR